jgi:rSAM/selenodomain-associated transferase 2
VIPCLDEQELLPAALASVREADELVVVDGGSRDGSAGLARQAGALVLQAPPSRGGQLRAGAEAARGDWLLFLHADTRLEAGWAGDLRALPPGVVGGAFRLAIDAPGWGPRLLERAVDLRTRLLGLPYGDQALFARRSAYDAAGGFRPLPLMEDVDFVRRLRRQGPPAWLRRRALTSARRLRRHGLAGATLRNWRVLGCYLLGVSPERLVRLYDSPSPEGRGRRGDQRRAA